MRILLQEWILIFLERTHVKTVILCSNRYLRILNTIIGQTIPVGKIAKIWHNIDARRLDAPLIQAAGTFFLDF